MLIAKNCANTRRTPDDKQVCQELKGYCHKCMSNFVLQKCIGQGILSWVFSFISCSARFHARCFVSNIFEILDFSYFDTYHMWTTKAQTSPTNAHFNKPFTAHCDIHKVGTQVRDRVIRCLLQKLSDLGQAFWQASRTFATVYFVQLSTPVAIQLACLISNFCHDSMLWHEGI